MRLKPFSYWLIIFVFLYALFELWAAIGFKLLHEIRDVDFSPFPIELIESHHKKKILRLIAGETKYTTYSRELGWTIKPNGISTLETANSQGIRGDFEYNLKKGPDKIRIAAFGDSFTHGSNVVNADTWTEVLRLQDPRLEVINFGVGGYGLDQAFLRYQEEGVGFESDIVLIGYMSDDITRHINTFRPFTQPLTGMPLAKPRFILNGDKLALVPNPIQSVDQYRMLLEEPEALLNELGKHDVRYQHSYSSGSLDFLPSVRLTKELIQFYRYPNDAIFIGGEYNDMSEAYQVTERLFDAFYEAASRQGSLPVIVIFPNSSDIRDYRRFGTREYAPLIRHFEERRFSYIDALQAFAGDASKFSLEDIIEGHYTPLGNKLVGKHVYEYLKKHGLLNEVGSSGNTEKELGAMATN